MPNSLNHQNIAKVHAKLHKQIAALHKEKVAIEQRKLALETLYAKTRTALTIDSARVETELSELFVVREARAAKAAALTPAPIRSPGTTTPYPRRPR
jgi:hypothetical protein